jgi:hypothetical protein
MEPDTDSVTLDYVLSHRNVNDQCYLSDIDRWAGVELPINKIKELRNNLTAISKRIKYG